MQTGRLYFHRADKFEDEHEGLPPGEYERVLNLSNFDLNDIQERDHNIGPLAQFRQSFYVNCWHLHIGETATMWSRYGKDGCCYRFTLRLAQANATSLTRQGDGRSHQVRDRASDGLERRSIRNYQA